MYILLFFSQEVIAVFIFSLLWGRQCRLIFLFKEAKEAKGTVLLAQSERTGATRGTVLLAGFDFKFDFKILPIFSLDIPVKRANCLIEQPFS